VSQYSSSSLRWSGSVRELITVCLRGHVKATHSVEALDIADVLVDEELHLVGHVGHDASPPRARDERHFRGQRSCSDDGGVWGLVELCGGCGALMSGIKCRGGAWPAKEGLGSWTPIAPAIAMKPR
jgi:hypothetical protein